MNKFPSSFLLSRLPCKGPKKTDLTFLFIKHLNLLAGWRKDFLIMEKFGWHDLIIRNGIYNYAEKAH